MIPIFVVEDILMDRNFGYIFFGYFLDIINFG